MRKNFDIYAFYLYLCTTISNKNKFIIGVISRLGECQLVYVPQLIVCTEFSVHQET